jgi:hypothetical protein
MVLVGISGFLIGLIPGGHRICCKSLAGGMSKASEED